MQSHETGVWTVEYPEVLKRAVEDIAYEWDAFCTLPSACQDVFSTTNMFNGVGFERKTGTGSLDSQFSNDKKLNFDVTQASIATLAERVGAVSGMQDQKIASGFIKAATALTHHASSAIKNFGSIIESNHGVSGFHNLAAVSAENAFFRTLYYPPTQEVGEIIGEPHVDNSGFTLHLFESTEGCEALTPDRQSWEPMPVVEGSALAFPSMQTQLYSNGEIDGLCHRIISNETTHAIGRRAIVCFVPLAGIPSYDRVTHGRLQEKTPGFNYGMESYEFERYFNSI